MKENNKDNIDEAGSVDSSANENVEKGNANEDTSLVTTVDNELHALDTTPSMSRTTNIPPRLPEGYSYTSQPVASEKTTQQKAKAKTTLDPEPADLPLRSEPTQTRSKRYRAHKPNKTWQKTKRVVRRYGWLIIFPAIAATYPLWVDHVAALFHTEEPAPAVAADTVPQVKPVVVDTDSVPQLTHEDSLRIQDSIRHARYLYWQRNKKRQAAEENVTNEDEKNGEAEATTSTSTSTTNTHNGTVHRDSL